MPYKLDKYPIYVHPSKLSEITGKLNLDDLRGYYALSSDPMFSFVIKQYQDQNKVSLKIIYQHGMYLLEHSFNFPVEFYNFQISELKFEFVNPVVGANSKENSFISIGEAEENSIFFINTKTPHLFAFRL